MIIPFKNFTPKIHKRSFVAPNATLVGQVTIAKGASIWFGAVLRGDINRISIGELTNGQDNCVLHVESDTPCILKKGVIMGHQATAHACTIEDGALIGIGARILNRARVGRFSVIGAGAVVKENAVIPPYSLAVGIPAKVVRRLTPKEIAKSRHWALKYDRLGKWYQKNLRVDLGGLGPADLSEIF